MCLDWCMDWCLDSCIDWCHKHCCSCIVCPCEGRMVIESRPDILNIANQTPSESSTDNETPFLSPITNQPPSILSTVDQSPSLSPITNQPLSLSSTVNQLPSLPPITTQPPSISSTVNQSTSASTTTDETKVFCSQRSAEGKKNAQSLQELMRISHPHVYEYFHKLKDPNGVLIFPEDPKKLFQKLIGHEQKLKRMAGKEQQHLLFPDGLDETDSSKFDLSLFKLLIVNFGQTGKPRKFWQEKPPVTDVSEEANISRLFVGRNSIQHGTGYVADDQYKKIATDIINALVSLGEDKNELSNLLPPIQYRFSKPVNNFYGRHKDLKEIHKTMQYGMNDTLRVVVYGLAGIGKSETVRKYCYQNGHLFDDNILWISASNQTSLESSFKEIAVMVGLAIRDEKGNLKEITNIINLVHKHFRSIKILYVFDDVTNIQLVTPFLPKHKPSASIITTQLKNWPQNDFQMKKLTEFNKAEGTSFLKDSLQDKNMDETQLTRILNHLAGHPLAIQQFVVAIQRTMLSVKEYLNLLEKETVKLLEPDLVTMHGGKSAIGAIRITTEKLAETKGSKLSLKILNTISYFYGDEISFEVLKLIFINNNIMDIDEAVQKLESYSLIRKVDNNFIIVHALVQKSMMSQHKNNGGKYFITCLNLFKSLLKVEGETSNHESFGKEWYKHFIYFISSNTNHTEIHNLIFKRSDRIFDMLKTKGRIDDLIELYETLRKSFAEKKSPFHKNSIETMFNLAQCYYEVCRYNGAIELYQKVLDEKMKLHGKTNDETLRTMNNLATCWKDIGRLDEAIKMFIEILDGDVKLHGKKHQSTLVTMNNLATCFKDEKRLDEAINMFEEVLDEFVQLYGEKHQSTLSTKNNLASCFRDIGRLDEAVKMFEDVLKEKMKLHGKRHQSTLITMEYLASCFRKKGKLDEAINIFEEVYGERIELHGKTHPSTLGTMENLATCLQDKGRIEEAKDLFKEALTICKTTLAENHPLTKTVERNFFRLKSDSSKKC